MCSASSVQIGQLEPSSCSCWKGTASRAGTIACVIESLCDNPSVVLLQIVRKSKKDNVVHPDYFPSGCLPRVRRRVCGGSAANTKYFPGGQGQCENTSCLHRSPAYFRKV